MMFQFPDIEHCWYGVHDATDVNEHVCDAIVVKDVHFGQTPEFEDVSISGVSCEVIGTAGTGRCLCTLMSALSSGRVNFTGKCTPITTSTVTMLSSTVTTTHMMTSSTTHEHGHDDDNDDTADRPPVPCGVCFRQRGACTVWRTMECQIQRGRTFSNFDVGLFLLNAVFVLAPTVAMAFGFMRLLGESGFTQVGATWYAITDMVRGICNLVLVLLLLNAWVHVTHLDNTVLAFQYGSVEVENDLALVLFIDFIILLVVYVCDIIGFARMNPNVSCNMLFCGAGLNFMVVLYIIVAVLAWMELLVMVGAPAPPDTN